MNTSSSKKSGKVYKNTALSMLIALILSACSINHWRTNHHFYLLVDEPIPIENYAQSFHETHPHINIHVFYGFAAPQWPQNYDATLLTQKPELTNDFQDLTPLLEADDTFAVSDILPEALTACRQGEKLLCLPLGIDFDLLLYNEDDFAEAQIPPPPEDATWTWWMDAVVRLDEYNRQHNNKGAVLATGDLQWTLLGNWLWNTIQPYQEIEGELAPRLNTPETLTFVKEQRQRMMHLTVDSENDSTDPVSKLIRGKATIALISYSQLRYLRTILAQYPQLRVAPVPHPALFGSGEAGPLHVSPVLVMSRGTTEPYTLWQWFAFLSKHYLPARHLFPARRSLINATLPGEEKDEISRLFPFALSTSERSSQEIDVETRDALRIIYQHLLMLIFAPSLDEAQSIQAQAEKALSERRQSREQEWSTFTVVPPIPPAELRRKHPLRIYDMALAMPSSNKAIVTAFQEKHPQWLPLFWPEPAQADAIASAMDTSSLITLPGTFPTAMIPVENIEVLSVGLGETDFYPLALKNITWRKQLPGLPIAIAPRLLYFDSVLMARHDMTPNDSWTMQDILDAAIRIKRQAPQTIAYAPEDGYEIAFFLDQLGISLFTEELQPQFTASAPLRALAQLQELTSPQALLAGGKAAFLFSRPYRIIPDTYTPVALTPRSQTLWPMTLYFYGVTPSSQHPDMAWEWAAFTARHPDIVASNALPALKSLAEDEATRTRLGPERYDAYMTMLQRIPARSLTDADILKGAALWWFDQALRQVGPDTDLRAALAPAQDKAQAFLTCTGPEITDMARLTTCARQVDPDHPLASQAP